MDRQFLARDSIQHDA